MSENYITNHGISIVIDHKNIGKSGIEENNNGNLNEAFNMNNNYKNKSKNSGKQIESTKIKIYQELPTAAATPTAAPPTTTTTSTKFTKTTEPSSQTVTKTRSPSSPRFASKILSKFQQIRSKTTKITPKTSTTTTTTCISINGSQSHDLYGNNDGVIIKHHHDASDNGHFNDDDGNRNEEQTKDGAGYTNDGIPPQQSSLEGDTQSTTTITTTSTTESLTPFNSTITLKESNSSQTAAVESNNSNSITVTTLSAAKLASERGKLEDVGKLPQQLQQSLPVSDADASSKSRRDADESVTENANGTSNQTKIMTKHDDRQTTIIECNIHDDNNVKRQQQQRQHVDEESPKENFKDNDNDGNDNEIVAVANSTDESQTIITPTTTYCNSISINRFGAADINHINGLVGMMRMGAGAGVGVAGRAANNSDGAGQQTDDCNSISKLDWPQQRQDEAAQPQPELEEPEQQLKQQQQQQQQQQQKSDTRQLGNVCATPQLDSRPTKADCASALTETASNSSAFNSNLNPKPSSSVNSNSNSDSDLSSKSNSNSNSNDNSHVVTIQINQPIIRSSHENNSIDLTKPRAGEKQVTVVKVNEQSDGDIVGSPLVQQADRIDLHLSLEKMVQKPINGGGSSNPMPVGNISSGGTTVTELNVNNSTYLYYMMSSGQFSPCDTLDSGTGSDLESSNGNAIPNGSVSPKISNKSLINSNNTTTKTITTTTSSPTPKLELHLKTTKIRVSNGQKSLDKQHQRAGSLTDSEESEVSSLSCDSLHSTEFIRQSSVSPTSKSTLAPTASGSALKMMKPFLPDSLLRDIRDRKFPTNDFEAKYGAKAHENGGKSSADDEDAEDIEEDGDTFVQHRKPNSKTMIGRIVGNSSNRASMPLLNKTYEMEDENGQFIDTKMSSMPRKYEADKYYNFHVKEHENFRTFGNNINGHNGKGSDPNGYDEMVSDLESVVHEDDFVGYKDIRFGPDTSTIRSSKGTVRGVKNRVRNGIATFLQMQEPQLKNYKVKESGKVVLYTTSMGIIRETYAKCANVKQILRTLLVKFEERDVFMSLEYQQEIRERMHSDIIKVPQLFVEGQHIGNAETVERLNESGELRQLLKPYKCIATAHTCQTCGGYRLLPCPSCKGSKKSVHRNHFTTEFVALKCMNCDEVGLVKCHNC